MKKLILICSVLFGLLFISQAQTTVNVAATARQTFNGFGISQIPYSCCRDAYVLTPPAKRAQMAALVYTELKSNILRMWLSPGKDISDLYFYRDSIVPEAKRKGVTTFLLAPGIGEAPPADYGKWGRDVADYIKMAIDNGLQIDVSGVNNEPGMNYEDPNGWSLAGMATSVKEMRTRLNSYGLSRIGIVAPEGANSDDWCLKHLKYLKGDNQAWNALRGVASHSYNFSLTEDHGQVALTGNKEYWMTEASDNGTEDANNSSYPYGLIRRFLNDLNHGATHWIYFIGYYYEANNTNDGRTKLVNYDPNTGNVTAWPKYWYMKHALSVFPYGTIFRHSTSPTKGEMNQNGTDKSNLNVAAGKRPDGKFAIAVTSDIQQSVTINIAELNGQNITFQVLKSSLGNYQQSQSSITTSNGSVTINVGAKELITLTSGSTSAVQVTGVTVTPTTTSIAVGATTALTVAVAPANATNKNVTWSSNNTTVATVSTTGVVTGIAAGSATITVTTQDVNKTATSVITVTSAGAGVNVPAKIQAENWTSMSGVQAENTTDAGGGQNVGYIDQNDWIDYAINVPTAGTYTIDFRLASVNSGRQFQMKVGATILTTVTVPQTGGWQNWQTVTTSVNLSAGAQTIRLLASNGNGWNINWFEIKNSSSVAVSGVTLSPTTASVVTGATTTLSATVAPANATNKNVTWSSSNTAIATVSTTGIVTGVATGTATITVTTQDGNKTATCAVTVTAGGGGATNYEAESGTYGGGGQTQTASNASNGQVVGNLNALGSYSQVASVNGAGGGTASLVIRYSNGFSIASTMGLYVNGTFIQNVSFPVTGGWNTFSNASVSINLSSGTGNTIKLQIGTGNAAADIDKYSVTPGSSVSVIGVTVSPASANVVAGSSTTLLATVAPSNATNKNLSWTSGNTGVAIVNTSGVVTGVAAGTATIIVMTIDGNKTATCAITVTTAGTESKLTGNVIGTGGSGTSGATNDKVFDGNFATFYDAVAANGAWVGLDLGSAKVISTVKFAPRVSWASRMNGGKLQGSNTADFSIASDLFTISSNPAENVLTVGTVLNTTAFRYVRYLSPNNGYCNISELAFLGLSGLKPAKSVSTSIELQGAENMQVTAFPNPGSASDVMIVLAGYQNQKNISLRITDLSGRVVFKRTLQGQGLKIQSTTLGRSSLTKGIYTITVESNKLIKSTRLLLQ